MNIASLLSNAARTFPARPAVVVGVDTYATYARLAERAAQLSATLCGFGLQPGDRVALVSNNCKEFLEVLFGVWSAGLVAVTIKAGLGQKEYAAILANSGARYCIVTPRLAESVASGKATLPDLSAIVVTGTREYEGLFSGESKRPFDASPDRPAWLIYTSGTTGEPKGVVLTHRNLMALTNAYYADVDQLGPNDVMVHASPVAQGSGLYSLPFVAKAAANVVPASGAFDPAEILDLLSHHKNVSFAVSSYKLMQIVNHESVRSARLGKLKTVFFGAAPMSVPDLKVALNRLGSRLWHAYGQSESPNTISGFGKDMLAQAESFGRLESVGIARTGVEIRIVDDEDHEVASGECGEVAVRGDVVMKGYWERPELTQSTLRGGWLHTGDVGMIDRSGFLFLKGRLRDIIYVRGSHVYASDVEEVLGRHKGVKEVAVVGAGNKSNDQEVVAFIVVKSGESLALEELERECRSSLADYKRPRRYELIDELPRDDNGKVRKTELCARVDGIMRLATRELDR